MTLSSLTADQTMLKVLGSSHAMTSSSGSEPPVKA